LLWGAAALLPYSGLTASTGEAPDVVLVTIDTIRADRVGCYGDPSARTPILDGLAARGVRFARALTASPLTLPAHATLMTGVDPPRHGLHDNGLAALPESLPTLAGAFARAGYATGAFVAAGVLDRRFGLDRGFDVYDDRLTAEYVGEYGYPERDAAAVTDAALDWAAGLESGRPYFLWVHYYDPHSPYLSHGTTAANASEGERYAAEIAFTDEQLGRLLAALPGDSERRIVAAVGDHGEMLGEHGERAHGLLLYRASLEVPLIVTARGLEAGRVVERGVATRDLGPSLLRLARVPAPEGLDSALPELSGGTGDALAPVYSEAWLPSTAYGWSSMLAVTLGSHRYVQAPRPELYDFVADPAEARNLVLEEPERAAEMREVLGSFAVAPGDAPEARPVDDPELAARLRALGYLSGVTGAGSDAIDPKDGIALLAEFEAAKRLLSEGDVWAARARLDDLVRRNPSNVPFLMRAADAQFATGNAARGMALLERAAEINPRLDFLRLRIANARLGAGDAEGAGTAFREALELNPRLSGAWLGLAQLAAMAGDGAAERRRLEEAVAVGTVSGGIFARLGQIALAARDSEAADEYLRRATELVPELAPAWWSWGEVAESRGELEAAVERFARAIDLNPGDAGAQLRVGRLLARLGRIDEARQMLQRAADVGGSSPAGAEARRLLAAGLPRPDSPPPLGPQSKPRSKPYLEPQPEPGAE
jgi:arylsulfatase A-like enzyme/Tfp pilus assembly protein PilF